MNPTARYSLRSRTSDQGIAGDTEDSASSVREDLPSSRDLAADSSLDTTLVTELASLTLSTGTQDGSAQPKVSIPGGSDVSLGRIVADSCPFDYLVGVGFVPHGQTDILGDSATSGAESASLSYAIIDVNLKSVIHSIELLISSANATPGDPAGSGSDSVSLAQAFRQLDSDVQSMIASRGKSFCAAVFDNSTFEKALSRGPQHVEIPQYLKNVFDVSTELKVYAASARQADLSGQPSLSPLEQLIPPSADGRPPRYAQTPGLNRILALAQLCTALLSAPHPGDEDNIPFTKPGQRAGSMPRPSTTPQYRSSRDSYGSSPNGRRYPDPKLGDWICVNCGFSNYGNRRSCHKCNTLHPNDLAMMQQQSSGMYPSAGMPMDPNAAYGPMQAMWTQQPVGAGTGGQYPPRLRPFRPASGQSFVNVYSSSPSAGNTPISPAYSDRAQVGSYSEDNGPLATMMGPRPAASRYANINPQTPGASGTPSPGSQTPPTPSENNVAQDWNNNTAFSAPGTPTSSSDPSQFSPPRLTGKVLPGDWICGVCGVNNFSSRTECVSCRSGQNMSSGTVTMPMHGYQPYGRPMQMIPMQPMAMPYGAGPGVPPMATPSAMVGMAPQGYLPGYPTTDPMVIRAKIADPQALSPPAQHYGSRPRPSDRPGDWNCPNTTCKYHNYASRTVCYRCNTARPAQVAVGMNPAMMRPQMYARMPGMPMQPMNQMIYMAPPAGVQGPPVRIPYIYAQPAMPFAYGYPTTSVPSEGDSSIADENGPIPEA